MTEASQVWFDKVSANQSKEKLLEFINEESFEFTHAFDEFRAFGGDMFAEEFLKEFSDLYFTVNQYCMKRGWDLEQAIHEVEESNLTKFDNEGNPYYNSGKVIKGPNYRPANMRRVIDKW